MGSNPLLGFGRVVEVLQQDLAYEHVRLNRLSFVEDLDIVASIDSVESLSIALAKLMPASGTR